MADTRAVKRRKIVKAFARLADGSVDLRDKGLADGDMSTLIQQLRMHSPSIVALRLTGNRITAAGAAELAQVLPCLPTLRSLRLSYNKIGDEGAAAIAAGLRGAPAIESVAVRICALSAAGALAVARELSALPTVREVDLSGNKLGGAAMAAMAAFARCLRDGRWVKVDLRNCEMSRESAVLLVRELRGAAHLEALNLRGNRIDERCAEDMARALAERPPAALCDLSGIALRKHLGAMGVPPEFSATENPAILDYLRQRLSGGGPRRLAIAKVMVSGPVGCGKTCLVGRLSGGAFDAATAPTNGIDVRRWAQPGDTGLELLLYDFGGHPVYTTSHRLFLRSRAVFVVAFSHLRGGPPFADHALHAHAQDVLDASPDALVLFVTTKADSPASCALSVRELEALQRTYGRNFVGYHHVSSRTGEGLPSLLRELVDLADALAPPDPQVPQSYASLREAIARLRRDAPFAIGAERWRALCASIGIASAGGAAAALDLLHAWGEVLRLPSGAGDAPRSGSIVLSPEQFAGALSRVITADGALRGNARGGLLRHAELRRVWGLYPPDLRRSFLALLHESELGYAVSPGEAGATLVPAMLGASPDRAAALFEALRRAHPRLPPSPLVAVRLSSLPMRLQAALHAKLRRLAVLGGWWSKGCVVASLRPSGAVAGFGRLRWSHSSRWLSLEGRGADAALQSRVLGALRTALADFPGVRLQDLSVSCAGGTPKCAAWCAADLARAAADGAPLRCGGCGAGCAAAGAALWLREALAPGAEPLEAEAKEPCAWAGEAVPRGEHALAQLRQQLDLRCGREALQVALLSCQKALFRLSSAAHPRLPLHALWLVFAGGPAGALAAYPLAPHVERPWRLDAALRVALPAECGAVHCAAHEALNDVFARAVDALGVAAAEGEAFRGVLWSCAGEAAFAVEERTRRHFCKVAHPEVGTVWVHESDRAGMTGARVAALGAAAAAEVAAEIGRAASPAGGGAEGGGGGEMD